ncbi:30S ribosomal protein S6 alpha, chloroplastic [Trifolium repens]|nr:30S ribosomal protein S6 alpha, chloroplastic [Trifolium repens]
MMAFSSLTSIPLSSSCSLYAPSISSPFRAFPQSNFHLKRNNNYSNFSLKAQTLDFTGSFFEGGLGSEDDDEDDDDIVLPGTGFADLEEREEPQCPPGLRPYETMVVLRPDMSEDERLALTQKYEELLVAGGGMYVEVFNRGVIPLAYSIQKKNKEGESNTYMDGIYLLFTYFTKPESITALEDTLLRDDNVIRSTSFKIRKRRY